MSEEQLRFGVVIVNYKGTKYLALAYQQNHFIYHSKKKQWLCLEDTKPVSPYFKDILDNAMIAVAKGIKEAV